MIIKEPTDFPRRSLNNSETGLLNTDCVFQSIKPKSLSFIKKKNTSHWPTLLFNNNGVALTTHAKFLGLTFDSHLVWLPYVWKLKCRCLWAQCILNYLSHPKTGCNREVLFYLYQVLICSVVDYSFPVYAFIYSSYFQLVDTIQNSSLNSDAYFSHKHRTQLIFWFVHPTAFLSQTDHICKVTYVRCKQPLFIHQQPSNRLVANNQQNYQTILV